MFSLKFYNLKTKDSLSAHKIILMSRSPVFKAMFFGPARETSNEIKIEDITSDAFEEMLK